MMTTSTAGTTRPGAVGTPLCASAPGVGVTASGSTAPGVAARMTAATAVEPFGSSILLRGGAVVMDERRAHAPKPDAQLRASVRPRRDL